MKVLITSGGTRVPIDDVRYIGNMSTGRFGAEINGEFIKKYGPTHFLYAKGSKYTDGWLHDQYDDVFVDFDDYLQKSIKIATEVKPDIIVSAAAVSDYTLDKTQGKISSTAEEMIIRLKKTPKVLPLLKQASPKSFLVGFKLLVSPRYEEVYEAVRKVLNSRADCVVYNDLTEIRKGNISRLVFSRDDDGEIRFKKVENAEKLIDYITALWESENS